MRICVLGLRGLPEVMGGVETHCEQLLPILSGMMRADDFCVLTRAPYTEAEPPPYKGLRLVSIWTIKQKYLEAITHTAWGVLYARVRLRSDMLHLHAIGPGLLAPLAKMLGMSVIVTHHGADYRRDKWNLIAKAALRLGEWCAVTFADRVIVVSPSMTESLKRRFPRRAGRISYIPNGITEPPQSAPDTKPEAGVLDKFGLVARGYVLAVGRLVPEKGFADLIEAFRASNSRLKLVIAGGADHHDPFVAKLLAMAGHDVVFAGVQKRDQLATLYAGAALFVLASHHEGLPIVALEAIAAGAPVLLSDIAPNRDIRLSDAHYFPVGDVEALRDKLNLPYSLYDTDPQDRAADYDWSRIAAQTKRVYESVFGRD